MVAADGSFDKACNGCEVVTVVIDLPPSMVRYLKRRGKISSLLNKEWMVVSNF